MCDNCWTNQGPFQYIGYGKRVCKNTKASPNRIKECVERRKAFHAKQLLKSGGVEIDYSDGLS